MKRESRPEIWIFPAFVFEQKNLCLSQSGRGRLFFAAEHFAVKIRGEGLIGMTRGFMYAGAKRVVVSLWDVNDEGTAELMANFYREMLGGKKMSPASALRQAQISLLKDKRWQNPYFWATFTLQGEPK